MGGFFVYCRMGKATVLDADWFKKIHKNIVFESLCLKVFPELNMIYKQAGKMQEKKIQRFTKKLSRKIVTLILKAGAPPG
jgi:hypothetical protein